LVRVLSKIKKGIFLGANDYFQNEGRENDERKEIGKGANALEIGFGHVSNLMMVEDKGFSPTGLEVSEEAVLRGKARLKNIGREKIQLSTWDSRPNLDFPDKHFKLIYGLQCIYYNLDIADVIDEIYRCLDVSGVFCFSFFSTRHDYYKYSNVIEERDLYCVREWSDDHPSYRIRGARLVAPKSEKHLKDMFHKFSEVRVFTEETDFSPLFSSMWYVYGRK